MRGADVSADADDHIVLLDKKRKLKSYDVMLKQFRYGDALDEALNGRQPDAVSSLLLECCSWTAGYRFVSYHLFVSCHFLQN